MKGELKVETKGSLTKPKRKRLVVVLKTFETSQNGFEYGLDAQVFEVNLELDDVKKRLLQFELTEEPK